MQDNRIIVNYISLDNLKLYESEIFFNQDYPDDIRNFETTKIFVCKLLRYNRLINCYFNSIVICRNDDIIKLSSSIVSEINTIMALESLNCVISDRPRYKFLLYSFCGKLVENLTDEEIRQYLNAVLFDNQKRKITFLNPAEDIDNLMYLLFKSGNIITWSTSTNQWRMIMASNMDIDKVIRHQNQNIKIANGCCVYDYNTATKQAQFIGFFDDELSRLYTIDEVLKTLNSDNVECISQEFTLSVTKGVSSKIEIRDNNTKNIIDLVNQNLVIDNQKYKVTMLGKYGDKSHYMSLKQCIKFLNNKDMQQRANSIVDYKRSSKAIKVIYDFNGYVEVKLAKNNKK